MVLARQKLSHLVSFSCKLLEAGVINNKVLVLCGALLLTACASQRPAFNGPNVGELSAFKPNQAAGRVFISTGQEHLNAITGEQTRGFLRKAIIVVDGQTVAEVGPKEVVVLDLSAGAHEIKWLWKGHDGTGLIAKPFTVNLNNGVVKFLRLEFFDERSAGANVLGGMGVIGALASGAMATFRTEIIISSREEMADKTIVDYRKL